MKKIRNIVLGGIQQKVFNLVLITIILVVAAYTAVILYQAGYINTLVTDTNNQQKQSIIATSRETMDAVIQNSLSTDTKMEAMIADNLFKNLAGAVSMLGDYAEKILDNPERNVAEFLFQSIKDVCRFLGINTKFIRSSEIPGNDNYKREYRIYDFCHRLGGDTYINAVGGQDLYHFDDFEKHGVTLKFIRPNIRPYKQFHNEFVPGLSILDVIMFNSVNTIKNMLEDCSFIEKQK